VALVFGGGARGAVCGPSDALYGIGDFGLEVCKGRLQHLVVGAVGVGHGCAAGGRRIGGAAMAGRSREWRSATWLANAPVEGMRVVSRERGAKGVAGEERRRGGVVGAGSQGGWRGQMRVAQGLCRYIMEPRAAGGDQQRQRDTGATSGV
jgi:hypothetical protein